MTTASTTARRAALSDTVIRIGRVGLVGFGLVNLLIAFLVLKVATGDHSQQASKNGALGEVANQPFGKALLWIIGIGLIALMVWQLAEAIWGYQQAGKHRLMKRLIAAAKAVAFGVLGVSAAKFASGQHQSSNGSTTTTGKLLQQPFGQVLVVLLGLAIIGVAAFLIRHGLTKRFRESLDLSHADRRARKVTIRLGQIGYSAVGGAYAVVGALVVAAAVTFDPKKAAGLDGAMKTIASQPYGTFLLWLVAAGFACFGVYCFFDARYRKS